MLASLRTQLGVLADVCDLRCKLLLRLPYNLGVTPCRSAKWCRCGTRRRSPRDSTAGRSLRHATSIPVVPRRLHVIFLLWCRSVTSLRRCCTASRASHEHRAAFCRYFNSFLRTLGGARARCVACRILSSVLARTLLRSWKMAPWQLDLPLLSPRNRNNDFRNTLESKRKHERTNRS